MASTSPNNQGTKVRLAPPHVHVRGRGCPPPLPFLREGNQVGCVPNCSVHGWDGPGCHRPPGVTVPWPLASLSVSGAGGLRSDAKPRRAAFSPAPPAAPAFRRRRATGQVPRRPGAARSPAGPLVIGSLRLAHRGERRRLPRLPRLPRRPCARATPATPGRPTGRAPAPPAINGRVPA